MSHYHEIQNMILYHNFILVHLTSIYGFEKILFCGGGIRIKTQLSSFLGFLRRKLCCQTDKLVIVRSTRFRKPPSNKPVQLTKHCLHAEPINQEK